MPFEVVTHRGITFAEILWASTRVAHTTFFSPPTSSLQFGLLAHAVGYTEKPHYHKSAPKTIADIQQMFVVQRGVVVVQFFADDGELFREVELHPGDGILLVHGAHAIRVLEDAQCITVKQGPFGGLENDKVELSP